MTGFRQWGRGLLSCSRVTLRHKVPAIIIAVLCLVHLLRNRSGPVAVRERTYPVSQMRMNAPASAWNKSAPTAPSPAVPLIEYEPCVTAPPAAELDKVREFMLPDGAAVNESESHCPGVRVPDCLIIGFEKCGTIALLQYLKLNPYIRAFAKTNNRGFYEGVDTCRYLASHDPTPPRRLRVEKLALHGLPSLVHKFNKKIKLLAIVRDPVSRLTSHYIHRVEAGVEKAESLEHLVNDILDGKTDKRPECDVLISNGLYSVELRSWLRYFDLKQLHIVNGTNFVLNPAYELNLVEKFLGVESLISADKFEFNATKGFYCVKDNTLSSLQPCMSNTKGRQHPSISEALQTRLKEYFRPYNEDFFNIVGVRYQWNK